jgi:hypothetical protein
LNIAAADAAADVATLLLEVGVLSVFIWKLGSVLEVSPQKTFPLSKKENRYDL